MSQRESAPPIEQANARAIRSVRSGAADVATAATAAMLCDAASGARFWNACFFPRRRHLRG